MSVLLYYFTILPMTEEAWNLKSDQWGRRLRGEELLLEHFQHPGQPGGHIYIRRGSRHAGKPDDRKPYNRGNVLLQDLGSGRGSELVGHLKRHDLTATAGTGAFSQLHQHRYHTRVFQRYG